MNIVIIILWVLGAILMFTEHKKFTTLAWAFPAGAGAGGALAELFLK